MRGLVLHELSSNLESALTHLFRAKEPARGDLLVLGCSTSSVIGEPLGSSSSFEIAGSLLTPLLAICKKLGVIVAIQGCEHINRTLVVPKSEVVKRDLTPINIIPELGAGGALASAYFSALGDNAIVVENLGRGADFGMHLRRDRVAVPVTINCDIGHARVIGAFCRYKWAGGPRTHFVD